MDESWYIFRTYPATQLNGTITGRGFDRDTVGNLRVGDPRTAGYDKMMQMFRLGQNHRPVHDMHQVGELVRSSSVFVFELSHENNMCVHARERTREKKEIREGVNGRIMRQSNIVGLHVQAEEEIGIGRCLNWNRIRLNKQLPFPACFLIRIIIVRDGAGFFHPYVVVVVVIITTDGAAIIRKFERVVGDTRMGLMVVLVWCGFGVRRQI